MNSVAVAHQPIGSSTFRSKIAYLDGLRGFAALVVVWTHFKELVLPGAPWTVHFQYEEILHNSPIALIFSSKLAVLLFFVHSGLVLSWKYLFTLDHRVLISMLLRRGFRLGIPIAVSVIFAFVLMRAGAMHNNEAAVITGAERWTEGYRFDPTLRTALTDAMGGALLYSSVRYNGALWTMPIELICSYGVFLLLPLIGRLRTDQMILAFAIACLSLLSNYHWMVCFMAGIVLARVYQEGGFNRNGKVFELFSSLSWLRPTVFAVVVVFAVYPDWSGIHLPLPKFLNPKETVQIIAAVLLVVLVLISPFAQRLLSYPVSRFLGRVSFSAYLVHLPIICSFSSWMIIRLAKLGVGYGKIILLTLSATIPMVYLVSWLMTVCVDRWAINFGKRFLERRLYPERYQPAEQQPAVIGSVATQQS
jgi:peptidoglycan/LPS O-acetylase OafA/YrhL